eukprot:g6329.t1
MSQEKLLKLALILHEVYHSYDVVLHAVNINGLPSGLEQAIVRTVEVVQESHDQVWFRKWAERSNAERLEQEQAPPLRGGPARQNSEPDINGMGNMMGNMAAMMGNMMGNMGSCGGMSSMGMNNCGMGSMGSMPMNGCHSRESSIILDPEEMPSFVSRDPRGFILRSAVPLRMAEALQQKAVQVMGSTFTKISFSGDVSSNARIMSVQESGGTPRVGYIDLGSLFNICAGFMLMMRHYAVAACGRSLAGANAWQCQASCRRKCAVRRAPAASGRREDLPSVAQLEQSVNLACTCLRDGARARAWEISQEALQKLLRRRSRGRHLHHSLEYALRVNLSCATEEVAERELHLREARFGFPAADPAYDVRKVAFINPAVRHRLHRHAEALTVATQLCRVDPASTFLALREVFRSQPDDVFVVTFPRCGTTWMVQIAVCCLFGAAANYEDHALFLEGSIASSAAYVQHMEAWSDKPRPRLFKSHVPAEMHPGLAHGEEEILQEHGKVIYVVRNPKDALISLRHHHANNPAIGWTGSWDEWVRQWIAGDRSQEYGGSYFEHVKGWWTLAQRHPQRIRIFYFEEMKANLRQSVAEVAEFLQTSLGSTQVDEVCKACRFESMRGRHQVSEDIRSVALSHELSLASLTCH